MCFISNLTGSNLEFFSFSPRPVAGRLGDDGVGLARPDPADPAPLELPPEAVPDAVLPQGHRADRREQDVRVLRDVRPVVRLAVRGAAALSALSSPPDTGARNATIFASFFRLPATPAAWGLAWNQIYPNIQLFQQLIRFVCWTTN